MTLKYWPRFMTLYQVAFLTYYFSTPFPFTYGIAPALRANAQAR